MFKAEAACLYGQDAECTMLHASGCFSALRLALRLDEHTGLSKFAATDRMHPAADSQEG